MLIKVKCDHLILSWGGGEGLEKGRVEREELVCERSEQYE